ncbi:MAG: aspartate aminotransferase family protein [Parahaliea sp.]
MSNSTDNPLNPDGPSALVAWGPSADAREKDLIVRRQAHFGGSMLFYRDPLHIVRGEGALLYDVAGRAYLDCYNNVASVGHCHPRVTAALCQQAQTLNTHTRYLHQEVVNYAERLAATFPEGLDMCLLVCTGTEANELAMRIARAVTGRRGAIVMENAYHGNSTLVNELSTLATPRDKRPPYITAVEPPNTYRGPFGPGEQAGKQYADLVDDAIATLEANGEGVAAFVCDTIFDTQGTLEVPRDYFTAVYSKVREAGGLCIADEVQAGLARTGEMWGFEHYGVVPDIVTLGKPMGDGHPIGVVVTRRDILEQFTRDNFYFNTFGGNPVSAAVGNAVLDVLQDEGIVARVRDVSAYLRRALQALADRHPTIGDVRGRGLFLGVELVLDRETKAPASTLAASVAEAMREQGVLIGVTGRHGNVIKIRPPQVFSRANADTLIAARDRVLATSDNHNGC